MLCPYCNTKLPDASPPKQGMKVNGKSACCEAFLLTALYLPCQQYPDSLLRFSRRRIKERRISGGNLVQKNSTQGIMVVLRTLCALIKGHCMRSVCFSFSLSLPLFIIFLIFFYKEQKLYFRCTIHFSPVYYSP